MEWLGLPGRLAQSDTKKRWEILHEFFYYLFDSLLIPLIRTNFHVTESNVHGSRLFYFRHDVWRSLAEPALTSLKSTMFEEIKRDEALKLLESRVLGYSQVRLVPKETGVRPIMNLRRKQPKVGTKNRFGSSINTLLAPVYNVLTLERVRPFYFRRVLANFVALKSRPTRLNHVLYRRLVSKTQRVQIQALNNL